MELFVPLSDATKVYVYKRLGKSNVWRWVGRVSLFLGTAVYRFENESLGKTLENLHPATEVALFPDIDWLGEYIQFEHGELISWCDNYKELARLKAMGKDATPLWQAEA